jgi:hypothetical protein
MELNPSAFSPDGFLLRQRDTGHIPFGVLTSDKNGCGWIAAYNFLRADLHPVKWDQVRRDLCHLLPFRGRIGANAFVLRAYLRRKGCRLHSAVELRGARRLIPRCRAGILLYETGHSRHYVAFQRRPGNRLRFFNVNSPTGEVTMEFEEFYREFVRFPVFFLFTTE